MLKLTASVLAVSAILATPFAAVAGSLAAPVVEAPPVVAVAPSGSLGGWAPLLGVAAGVALIALVASDDDDDSRSTGTDARR